MVYNTYSSLFLNDNAIYNVIQYRTQLLFMIKWYLYQWSFMCYFIPGSLIGWLIMSLTNNSTAQHQERNSLQLKIAQLINELICIRLIYIQ